MRLMQELAASGAGLVRLWSIRRCKVISGSGPPCNAHCTASAMSALGAMKARKSSPNVFGRELGTAGLPSSCALARRMAGCAFFRRSWMAPEPMAPLKCRMGAARAVQSSQRQLVLRNPFSSESLWITRARLHPCTAHRRRTSRTVNASEENSSEKGGAPVVELRRLPTLNSWLEFSW